jgi:hypothetical protein
MSHRQLPRGDRMRGMKMKTFCSLLAVLSICALGTARAEDKTAGEKTSGTTKATKQAASSNTTAKKGANADNAPSGPVTNVDINMTDRGPQMPSTVPAGHVKFTVTNGGDLSHTLAITGGTLKNVAVDTGRGKNGVLDVVLTPGKYQAACTFSGHEGKEARTSFTVK